MIYPPAAYANISTLWPRFFSPNLAVSLQHVISNHQYGPTPGVGTNLISAESHSVFSCFLVTYSVLLIFTGLAWNRALLSGMPGTMGYNSIKLLRMTKAFRLWYLCAELGPSSMVPPSVWAWWKLLQQAPDCPVRKLCGFSWLEDLLSPSVYKSIILISHVLLSIRSDY